jgi:hypothetical protein
MDVIANVSNLLIFFRSFFSPSFTLQVHPYSHKKSVNGEKERMIKLYDRNSLSSVFEYHMDEICITPQL